MEKLLNNHLKTHLAKSDGTTIREHIDDLFRQFDIFINHYPEVLTEKEKELLKVAIEYHDYGKLNKLFQCKLPANPKLKPVKCSNKKDDKIPHQYLSPLFLENLKDKFNFQELSIIIYSIINHHTRGREYLNNVGIKLLIDELEKNISNFFSHIGINALKREAKIFYQKCLEYIVDNIGDVKKINSKLKVNDDFVRSIIKISGFLIRIDHSASGGDLIIEEDPIKENREILFLNYLEKNNKSKKLRPFQKKFKDKENLVLVADTGLGKTGLSVLWSQRKKFYILPNRASVNAMYNTLTKVYGEGRVGLLHSTALFNLIDNYEDEISVFKDYDQTRVLSKPVTVCTADQLFTAAFNMPGYEKIYATLSYSDVVIDEIQGFQPQQIIPILKQIRETKELGTRYLIITATLPEIVANKLREYGFYVIDNDETTIDKIKRHKIKIEDKKIEDLIDNIIEKCKKNKKVLVVTNTVGKAQQVFQTIKNKTKQNDDKLDINILHSRFIWKDRQEKEENILKACEQNKDGTFKNPEGCIWVCTQLVEASLDIDFDYLFTEAATADSLIQRMGRVWRHKSTDYNGDENIIIAAQVEDDIYEEILVEKSIEMIEYNIDSEKFLNSEQKRKIVKDLYNEGNLKNWGSKYLEEWQSFEHQINSGWNFILEENAQKAFRDVMTIELIPAIYKDNIISFYNLINEIIEKINQDNTLSDEEKKNKKRLERTKLLKKIQEYKVPVPIYLLNPIVSQRLIGTRQPIEWINKEYGIGILNSKYDYSPDIGLNIKRFASGKEMDDNIL